MTLLKYTIIKNKKQYNEYCNKLEKLLSENKKSNKDEIELLTLLIEKWDSEHNSFNDLSPIELIKFLMAQNNISAKELGDILDLSKGTISKILNYYKGLSKETIRRLSDYFKISQEAFNRPYKLENKLTLHRKTRRLGSTKKKVKKVIAK